MGVRRAREGERRGSDQEKDGPAAAAVAAEMAQDSEIDEDTDFVCMMANEGISPQSASSNRRTYSDGTSTLPQRHT